MRAAVYYSNSDVRIEERPVPQIGPGELLLRIEASSICGSDVMEWYRKAQAPVVLGHEVSGQVAAVGKEVWRYKEGDRVTAAHHVPCNACRSCLRGHHTLCPILHRTSFDPGGFAEYVRLTPIHVEQGVFPVPDHMSYEEAVFVEPLACVLRGQRMAGLREGDTVLVIGSGITGILHMKLARALGAGRILTVDVSEPRLEAARRLGANLALAASEDVTTRVREANDGRLADLVIVCTGAPAAVAQALASAQPGGVVLLFALPSPEHQVQLNLNQCFWRTDVTVTTTYGAAPGDYAASLDLIASGQVRVTDMITHHLGLSEVGLGFRLVAQAQLSLKVILDHRL
jgi:L-iditol 2-dehydrogenase